MRSAHRSFPSQTAPEGSTIPALPGSGQSPKASMISDSRKAQRDSFSRHRATLLFSNRIATEDGPGEWFASTHEGTEPKAPISEKRLNASIRDGLHGFLPLKPAAL
jgi:hypothetical protein